jgi:hypothetical protein
MTLWAARKAAGDVEACRHLHPVLETIKRSE